VARYVAFLRGINVGGRSIPMAELRACFEELGFADVLTVLQSGNVVFTSDTAGAAAQRERIEAGLASRFGYPAKALVYPLERLQATLDGNPFDTRGGSCHTYVVFVDGGLEQELAHATEQLDDEVEAVEAGDGVLYWRVVKGSTLDSPFAKNLTRARFREHHTSRNTNTLGKILAKQDGLPPAR
jgi:uncharacterized protein (DUF1697 family)